MKQPANFKEKVLNNKHILYGILIALLVVIVLAPFASSNPDGLERVAEDLAFRDKAAGQGVVSSPLPDYQIPGLKNEVLSGILAGIAGIALTFGLMIIFAKFLAKKKC